MAIIIPSSPRAGGTSSIKGERSLNLVRGLDRGQDPVIETRAFPRKRRPGGDAASSFQLAIAAQLHAPRRISTTNWPSRHPDRRPEDRVHAGERMPVPDRALCGLAVQRPCRSAASNRGSGATEVIVRLQRLLAGCVKSPKAEVLRQRLRQDFPSDGRPYLQRSLSGFPHHPT